MMRSIETKNDIWKPKIFKANTSSIPHPISKLTPQKEYTEKIDDLPPLLLPRHGSIVKDEIADMLPLLPRYASNAQYDSDSSIEEASSPISLPVFSSNGPHPTFYDPSDDDIPEIKEIPNYPKEDIWMIF